MMVSTNERGQRRRPRKRELKNINQKTHPVLAKM